MREVIDEVGSDAIRFTLLTRSADSTMDFDLKLAKEQSSENPVYYVQYAHARIASILKKAKSEGFGEARRRRLAPRHAGRPLAHPQDAGTARSHRQVRG